jgi:hypothetical protein
MMTTALANHSSGRQIMRKPLLLSLLALAVLTVWGCGEDHKTNPVIPPAAPRGLFSVTGNHQVTLVWYSNTESDVTAYRVYQAPCSSGDDCPYRFVAEVPANDEQFTECVVTGLTNGETRYYGVTAVNRRGGESGLSKEDVYDTPRPAGAGLALSNAFVPGARNVGYDFSAFARTDTVPPPTDIYYGYYVDSADYVHQQIFVPDYGTDIQDAGYADPNIYADPLDMTGWAPSDGWSPTGTVEAILGHNYVVWTRDDHFAKFRITAVSPGSVTLDWAYQIDAGNHELRAHPASDPEQATRLRPVVWLRR